MITKEAYAKINLTLEVGGKREDGYHSLKSVMARITLFDTVKVSKNETGRISFSSTDKTIPQNENLCTKAARAYFDAVGISDKGIDIYLENRIPTASGMGGGSADAAAVLECMEELFGKLAEDVRHGIARSLGADVPFCLEKTPCLCTGIGDECEKIDCRPLDGLWLTVSKKGDKLSTAKVYSDFDVIDRTYVEYDHSTVVNALKNGDAYALSKGSFNDFERVVFPSSPEVVRERERMLSHGALSVVMSGAGPTLIAFFDDEKKATECGNAYKIVY